MDTIKMSLMTTLRGDLLKKKNTAKNSNHPKFIRPDGQ